MPGCSVQCSLFCCFVVSVKSSCTTLAYPVVCARVVRGDGFGCESAREILWWCVIVSDGGRESYTKIQAHRGQSNQNPADRTDRKDNSRQSVNGKCKIVVLLTRTHSGIGYTRYTQYVSTIKRYTHDHKDYTNVLHMCTYTHILTEISASLIRTVKMYNYIY